jgi:hypothetical protein
MSRRSRLSSLASVCSSTTLTAAFRAPRLLADSVQARGVCNVARIQLIADADALLVSRPSESLVADDRTASQIRPKGRWALARIQLAPAPPSRKSRALGATIYADGRRRRGQSRKWRDPGRMPGAATVLHRSLGGHPCRALPGPIITRPIQCRAVIPPPGRGRSDGMPARVRVFYAVAVALRGGGECCAEFST